MILFKDVRIIVGLPAGEMSLHQGGIVNGVHKNVQAPKLFNGLVNNLVSLIQLRDISYYFQGLIGQI